MKKYKKDKDNDRLGSILSNMSNLYERRIHHQINEHFESKFQCGFREGFSAQNFLLVMFEKVYKLEPTK